MQSLPRYIKNALICITVFVQVFLPTAVLAQEANTNVTDPADSMGQSAESVTPEETPAAKTDTSTNDQTDPADPSAAVGPQTATGPQTPTGPQTTTGPTSPTGVSGSTYVYNDKTGLWENDYYTWDPVTKQTKPKQKQDYSYNPLTKMWDTTEWYFNPTTQKYEENKISVTSNPNAALRSGNASIGNTGPNSNNTINLGGNNTGTYDLFFDSSISNQIGQLSQSGDATVQNNLQGGGATSGDAETLLNLLNMLQSSWGDLGSDNISTFMANIDGDIYGDLMIDPSGIPVSGGDSNIDVNVSMNGSINNDIDVTAQSGDASVRNNTNGGSAKTGDARVLINLINMINSAIKSNKSFVGVLNINGNLEGDILLPPNLLNAIIASSGPNSSNTINAGGDRNLNVNSTTNTTIDNNIDAQAASGDATVDSNTIAGGALTGNAETNIRLLNLTGHRVVASNALIVFVNVLGSWVGLIMDAPAGTYSAAITGPNSTNTINATGNHNTDIDITANSQIENNIKARAASGDASVTGNTHAGDATSGDASANVNVLNMVDSDFHLSDWFGILFINVFGSWKGSFGVNTPFGDGVPGGRGGSPLTASSPNNFAAVPATTAGTFAFIPQSNTTGSSHTTGTVSASAATTTTPVVAASQIQKDAQPIATDSGAGNTSRNWWLASFSMIAFLILVGAERFSNPRP